MIIDKLENWKYYHFGPAWKRAFEFLDTLTPLSEEGKYTLLGDDDIFAIIMSYKTHAPEEAIFESHQKYVDIQTVLTGEERFESSFKGELGVNVPYDALKDIELYQRTTPGKTHIDVLPGTFVMLYPHDAHIAALMIGKKPKWIKKVVVKIKANLLLNPFFENSI
ncbi:MAG: hypothetical protein QG564_1486 [Campylobacterota bacterium]|nr:hypothetical protein [Campylobacterota bacterium]